MRMWDEPILPNIKDNFWELRDGVIAHEENPDTFEIPTKSERESIGRGKAAKLIFDIETQDEDGTIRVSGERMWVIVLSTKNGHYLGILDNEPSCIEPGTGGLEPGSKLWFKPEHVVGLSKPPIEYLIAAYPDEFGT